MCVSMLAAGEYSNLASSRFVWFLDRWRRPISGNSMGWLFLDVPLGLSFSQRRLQASAGHATVCKVLHCGELWRSVCPSPQWSRGHAVVAEDLNHTVWCTFLYSPAIQIAACDPSGEWPLP